MLQEFDFTRAARAGDELKTEYLALTALAESVADVYRGLPETINSTGTGGSLKKEMEMLDSECESIRRMEDVLSEVSGRYRYTEDMIADDADETSLVAARGAIRIGVTGIPDVFYGVLG